MMLTKLGIVCISLALSQVSNLPQDEFKECCKCIADSAPCNNFNGRTKSQKCPGEKSLCCDPVDNEIFEDTLRSSVNLKSNTEEEVCLQSDLAATIDFEHGVVCGKRDSRVYYDANQPATYTNPGEWPWAVLIYDQSGKYVAAGALVDNHVVVTVAHKMKGFTENPGALKVRLGDWNPNNEKDEKEEFTYVSRDVDCVILHPGQDLDNTLANNIAALKLKKPEDPGTKNTKVAEVVTLLSGKEVERPGNKPQGVAGSVSIDTRSTIDNRLDGSARDEREAIARNYFNTICLPKGKDQFKENCWVASWGSKQERQREVDLPLLTSEECIQRLSSTFSRKGVSGWKPQPSEVCAGGESGEDTCRGEGGAPLVCLDKDSDQYFLVGLVGYNFDCDSSLPGVYTNIADPVIQNFINNAIDNDRFCNRKTTSRG